MKQKNKTKCITVEYYEVCYIDTEDNKTAVVKICEISKLIETLKSADVKKRTIEYNGEYVILSDVKYNESSELWELVFFKSRTSNPPFITNENGVSRKIELASDEMFSEALCVEYDSNKSILIMQRNVYAFGTKCLETFFSKFLNYSIYLRSIQRLDKEKNKLFSKNIVKKFKLHVKNCLVDKNGGVSSKNIPQYKKHTTISNVIDSALAVNSAIINIEFSVGNSDKAIEIHDEDFEIFQDLMGNNNVKCLEVGFAPDEKSTMQITDFMDFRVHDTIIIQYSKDNPIDTSEIIDKMREKYKNNIFLGDLNENK